MHRRHRPGARAPTRPSSISTSATAGPSGEPEELVPRGGADREARRDARTSRVSLGGSARAAGRSAGGRSRSRRRPAALLGDAVDIALVTVEQHGEVADLGAALVDAPRRPLLLGRQLRPRARRLRVAPPAVFLDPVAQRLHRRAELDRDVLERARRRLDEHARPLDRGGIEISRHRGLAENEKAAPGAAFVGVGSSRAGPRGGRPHCGSVPSFYRRSVTLSRNNFWKGLSGQSLE